MFTGHEILKRRYAGDIVIEPFDLNHLNSNSYDLTLAPGLLWYPGKEPLDLKEAQFPAASFIPKDGMVLQPGELYLGCTVEYTESHDCIPMINGRSSLARLGISVHQTAGFGDINYKGNWTLEITCIKPIRIYAGIRFAQLCWFPPTGEVDRIYQGKYQNSRSEHLVGSRLYLEM